MASREKLGGHLAERAWMARVLDETHSRMDELAEVQRYPFPVDDGGPRSGTTCRGRSTCAVSASGCSARGPHPRPHPRARTSGRRRRRRVGGVALDPVGAPCASCRAVVLATGGCAFQSKSLGCDVNTGDGALMAVEAGAALSGMEFSNPLPLPPRAPR